MKRSNWLSILLIPLICLPVAASAQIVIDRYNSDGDPTQPTPTATDENEVEKKEEPSEEEAEKKRLSEDDLEEVRAVLLKQLQKTHEKCMKLDNIIRPEKANISGNATWEVEENGTAKFKQATAQVGMDMFFTSDREMERLSEAERDAARQRSNDIYNECAKGSDAKVGVKGKAGEVNLAFTVRHEKNTTRVELTEPEGDGGSVAIDL